jgi:hypothetical protein
MRNREGAGASEEVRVKKAIRIRFWVDVIFASLTGFLGLITLIWPDWIELVFGWDPDQHDGSVEWLIVAGAFLVAATASALAVVEWRRTRVFAA